MHLQNGMKQTKKTKFILFVCFTPFCESNKDAMHLQEGLSFELISLSLNLFNFRLVFNFPFKSVATVQKNVKPSREKLLLT